MIYIGQEQPECFEEGECTQSLFVGSYGAQDAQECLEVCKSDKNCLFFTFYGDEEECTNFSNCEVFSNDTCSNCVSGASTCEGKKIMNLKCVGKKLQGTQINISKNLQLIRITQIKR